MRFRNLTAPPIVVSQLLQSPEAQKKKQAGILVGDREVVEVILRELLQAVYKTGAVVDGFPRTKVQVECLKLFYHKLIELREKYVSTSLAGHFKKPHFHIVVLFVDEKESVRRQLNRGRQVQAHNDEVKLSGMGELIELRETDLDPDTALNRYRTFKEKTYVALKDLREIFFYHFINAHGTIEEVCELIDKELCYQGLLELDEATYDRLSKIPVATEIALHARQDLVNRLDSYEMHNAKLFAKVVTVVNQQFMPVVKRHAISGMAVVYSEDETFHEPKALAIGN